MNKIKILSLILLAAFLTACGGMQNGAENEPQLVPTQGELVAPPTAAQPVVAASCTVTSQYIEEAGIPFAEVQADDWVAGPDDAYVTIVEYGDFQ